MTATASTEEAPPTSSAKRARFLAATGLPAVLVAGGVILPTVAHAAPAAGTTCPAGSTPSPVTQSSTNAPVAAAATLGAPAPGTTATTGAGSTLQPSVPQPSGSTPAAPAPSSAPSGAAPTSAPSQPATPTGTSTPAPAPSSSPSSVPSSAPSSSAPAPTSSSSPTGGPTWWAPWTWLNSTTPSAAIFNPTPQAGGGIRKAAVNQLGSAKVANPAVVAALATTAPTTAPTTTPTTTASSSPSTPASSPSTSASTPPSTVCVKAASLNAPNEALWHLHATALTLYGMTYNGVVTINTASGPVNVLDFTADAVDVDSMTTYSTNPGNGKNDFANGGNGQTVALTKVHLHVLKQTGNITIPGFPFIGIPVTLEPGNIPTDLLGVLQGVTLPIVSFSGVQVDQYLLTAKTLAIPGFNAYAQQ